MPDAGFEIVFWVFVVVSAMFAVLMAVAMLFHFAVFGTIFGMAVKRIGEAHAAEAASRVERRCGHCGAAVPAGAKDCPKCGAPVA